MLPPTLSDLAALDAAGMPSLFRLPPEVERLREEAREFARQVVRPRAEANDLAPAGDFDWAVIREGHRRDLLRLTIPAELGGRGAGVLGVAVVMEEIAAACPATALVFGASLLALSAVLFSADRRLQARFLPPFLSDDPVLACNAITEDEAGCDLLIPGNAAHVANPMTATRDGDHYILNGTKRFITNGQVAEWATVFATVTPPAPRDGRTVFIVGLDTPGITRSGIADKMGYRACLGTTLEFAGVAVPSENVVLGEGLGQGYLRVQSNQARSIVAAISTGVARGAFEIAASYARRRVQGGRPLIEHQFTARKLAEMTAKVDGARLLYLQAAYQADHLLPAPDYGPATAKLFADRAAIEVTEEAMSILGARGYCREYGIEKLVRDSFGARIYEGTPEVLALAIAGALARPELSADEAR
jgi:hypothetical protein